jgi:hypothetical protein
MDAIYGPCPCLSGLKFKFCCLKKDPEELLQGVAHFPLHECRIANTNWQKNGLAVLYVCRQMIESRYICAFYMVDAYCLGLKNTFAKVNLDRSGMVEFREQLAQKYPLLRFDYEDARSLILGAIDYAARFGFQPNEDWRYSRFVIEHARSYVPKYRFGRDGKPYYIQGPHDNVREIMSKLATVNHEHLVRL